jgi:hypothetical protein
VQQHQRRGRVAVDQRGVLPERAALGVVVIDRLGEPDLEIAVADAGRRLLDHLIDLGLGPQLIEDVAADRRVDRRRAVVAAARRAHRQRGEHQGRAQAASHRGSIA